MNKFNAKKTIVNNIVFDSKKEANYYSKLLLQKKAKSENQRVANIELQPKFEYLIEYKANGLTYQKKAFYKADFRVTYFDGHVEVIDVKGFKTQIYKQKKKIIEALYLIEIIEK